MSGLLARLLTLPGRLLRGLWRFVEPPLKFGRIPFGRTILVLQAIAALIFVGYTLIKKDVRLPFSSEPYLIDVILPDAEGLDPVKEPSVGVAGVPAGKVVGARTEGGQARVTMRLDPDFEGKVFADATAFVRPTSVLQTLIVNIDPGDPAAGPLGEGEPIPAANTDTFVHFDELTGVLDADTQAQVQVLISEAATALRGREPQLREILAQLGELTGGTTPLAEALADRRRLLSRLTSELDDLFTTLGQRGQQLAAALDLGSRTLEVTGARDQELAAATRELAPTLPELQRALAASRGLAEELNPALDELIPAAGELQPTAQGLRELAPELGRFVALGDELVDEGRRPAHLLAEGLRGQARRVRQDQIPALRELVDLVDLLFEYGSGVLQFAETFSGATSTNRRAGPYAQFAVINEELTTAGFGLGAAAARARAGKPSRLSKMLAEMLEHTCSKTNPAACLFRFNLPGLPRKPMLDSDAAQGG